jgi:hypothetical protein
MRKFLQTRVKCGDQLQNVLEHKYCIARDELIKKLSCQRVCVIFDETLDLEGQCVLNILIAPMQKQQTNKFRCIWLTLYF